MSNNKLSKTEIKERILNDPGFINSRKHSYSLESLLEVNPNGVTDQFAANLLMMTLEEFQSGMESAIKKYRQKLKVELD